MKKVLKNVVTVLIVLSMGAGLLAGCGSSSADRENSLYVYNWSEYIPQEVYQMFEEETGIHVVESTFSSNEEMLAKLVAGGSEQYDLIIASNYVIPAMKEQGLIQEIGTEKISNFENVIDSAKGLDVDPENVYSIPYMATITMVAVNTKMLDDLGVTIKSYNDLLNPALENNIVVPDDCREVVDVALKAIGADPDTKEEAVINSAYDWLEKLAPNIKLYDNDTPYTALATNEVAVGLVYNMDAAKAMAENEDIEIVEMEEPCEISYDNFVMTAGCKNIEAAQQFINFIHRPEVYKMCLEEYPCVCLNKAALELMGEEFLSNPASNVAEAEIARAHIIGDVADAASIYDEVFSRMKN